MHRAASCARNTYVARPSVRGVSVLAVVFAVACRGDVPTAPTNDGALVPTEPVLALTGGVGTPIFPTMPPGEPQPRGYAIGLNSSGQVTGGQFGLQGGGYEGNKPFRWTPGAGAELLTTCCEHGYGADINGSGDVAGSYQGGPFSGTYRGFVVVGTVVTKLPVLPGIAFLDQESPSKAFALNDAGVIVGYSPTPSRTRHAVQWSAGGAAILDLGTLGGTNSEAVDINNAGQVIGMSQVAGDAATHAFLWTSGTGMQDLNTLIGENLTSVVEINDAGQIIGTYLTSGGQSHAFRYTPGSGLLDLGTLGGGTSAPTGLNGRGEVVGSSTLADGSTHAFLWTPADGMEDITALTGVPEVRRLNDDMQTLTVTAPPSGFSGFSTQIPRLVQLQVTQSNSAPTALFEWWCNGLRCYFDASGSLDDKGIVSYQWNWGKPSGWNTDADVKEDTPYPAPGSYTATLTVTDAGGLTSTLSKTITVTSQPVAALTVSCSGLTCTFDATASSNTGSGSALRWIYFGDGAFAYSAVTATHTYAQPGSYTAAFETWDGSGKAKITAQVTVGEPPPPPPNQPPVASFTWSCVDLKCFFDASGSTDDKAIVDYRWTWGKSPYNNGQGMTPSTSYPAPGPRTVTLTVTDAEGLTATQTQTITVGSTQPPADAPPVASFTWSCPTLRCSFDASGSTDDVGIVSYEWTWGKEQYNKGTGVTTSTPYPASGPRTVTLTVTDTKGQTNTSTQTIMVP